MNNGKQWLDKDFEEPLDRLLSSIQELRRLLEQVESVFLMELGYIPLYSYDVELEIFDAVYQELVDKMEVIS